MAFETNFDSFECVYMTKNKCMLGKDCKNLHRCELPWVYGNLVLLKEVPITASSSLLRSVFERYGLESIRVVPTEKGKTKQWVDYIIEFKGLKEARVAVASFTELPNFPLATPCSIHLATTFPRENVKTQSQYALYLERQFQIPIRGGKKSSIPSPIILPSLQLLSLSPSPSPSLSPSPSSKTSIKSPSVNTPISTESIMSIPLTPLFKATTNKNAMSSLPPPLLGSPLSLSLASLPSPLVSPLALSLPLNYESISIPNHTDTPRDPFPSPPLLNPFNNTVTTPTAIATNTTYTDIWPHLQQYQQYQYPYSPAQSHTQYYPQQYYQPQYYQPQYYQPQYPEQCQQQLPQQLSHQQEQPNLTSYATNVPISQSHSINNLATTSFNSLTYSNFVQSSSTASHETAYRQSSQPKRSRSPSRERPRNYFSSHDTKTQKWHINNNPTALDNTNSNNNSVLLQQPTLHNGLNSQQSQQIQPVQQVQWPLQIQINPFPNPPQFYNNNNNSNRNWR